MVSFKNLLSGWLLLYTTNEIGRVEPIIYESISLDYPFQRIRFLASIKDTSKPISFYQRSIQHLYLPYTNAETHPYSNLPCAYTVLPLCLGVIRMWFWITPSVFDLELANLIAKIRPRQLSVRLNNLLHPGQPNFSEPFFSQITHLAIVDQDVFGWSGFELIPCLTHIRFDIPPCPAQNVLDAAGRTVRQIFEKCAQIQVCILEFGRSTYDRRDQEAPQPSWYLEGVEDERLVYILQGIDFDRDWAALLSGEPDTWDFADKRVAQQRLERRRYDACYVYDDEGIDLECGYSDEEASEQSVW